MAKAESGRALAQVAAQAAQAQAALAQADVQPQDAQQADTDNNEGSDCIKEHYETRPLITAVAHR